MARNVSEAERIAIAKAVRALLEARTAEGRRKWTQVSLAAACGVAQPTIRRAMDPDGVTPAVRAGVLRVAGKSMGELLALHGDFIEQPERRLDARERAIEIVVRRNQPLRKSTRRC